MDEQLATKPILGKATRGKSITRVISNAILNAVVRQAAYLTNLPFSDMSNNLLAVVEGVMDKSFPIDWESIGRLVNLSKRKVYKHFTETIAPKVKNCPVSKEDERIIISYLKRAIERNMPVDAGYLEREVKPLLSNSYYKVELLRKYNNLKRIKEITEFATKHNYDMSRPSAPNTDIEGLVTPESPGFHNSHLVVGTSHRDSISSSVGHGAHNFLWSDEASSRRSMTGLSRDMEFCLDAGPMYLSTTSTKNSVVHQSSVPCDISQGLRGQQDMNSKMSLPYEQSMPSVVLPIPDITDNVNERAAHSSFYGKTLADFHRSIMSGSLPQMARNLSATSSGDGSHWESSLVVGDDQAIQPCNASTNMLTPTIKNMSGIRDPEPLSANDPSANALTKEVVVFGLPKLLQSASDVTEPYGLEGGRSGNMDSTPRELKAYPYNTHPLQITNVLAAEFSENGGIMSPLNYSQDIEFSARTDQAMLDKIDFDTHESNELMGVLATDACVASPFFAATGMQGQVPKDHAPASIQSGAPNFAGDTKIAHVDMSASRLSPLSLLNTYNIREQKYSPEMN